MTIFGDVYCIDIYFWFLSPNENDLLISIPTKIDQIWLIGLDWRQIWYPGLGIILGLNSGMYKFERQGAEVLKLQKWFPFPPHPIEQRSWNLECRLWRGLRCAVLVGGFDIRPIPRPYSPKNIVFLIEQLRQLRELKFDIQI